jgi:sodium/bile acid cotransporter 7
MKGFVAKRWFLLLVCAGAILILVWPQGLGWAAYLDPSVAGAAAIFLSAWSLNSRKLVQAVLHPLAALWAVSISYGLLPALAWLFGRLLPHADMRIGLLLIASVPCTLASAAIWTRMAAGNEATALLVTLFTNLSSWLATTAWLMLGAGVAADQGTAFGMMARLVLVLVVPVGLGQMLRTFGPLAQFADSHRTSLSIVARLLTVMIMLKAAMDIRDRLEHDTTPVGPWLLVAVAALCLVIHIVAFGGGFWSSKALGCTRENQIAVALAGSQKTLPVALILFDAYFAAYPLAVIPVGFYHLGQLVLDTFLAERLAGRRPALPPTTDLAAESAL